MSISFKRFDFFTAENFEQDHLTTKQIWGSHKTALFAPLFMTGAATQCGGRNVHCAIAAIHVAQSTNCVTWNRWIASLLILILAPLPQSTWRKQSKQSAFHCVDCVMWIAAVTQCTLRWRKQSGFMRPPKNITNAHQ